MTTVDADGNDAPAFAGVVTYYTTSSFVYVMADRWDRPDIKAAGGVRQDLSKTQDFNRYVRQLVRHGDRDRTVERVRASSVVDGDVVLETDVPAVLFAGDVADDVIGPDALVEMAAPGD